MLTGITTACFTNTLEDSLGIFPPNQIVGSNQLPLAMVVAVNSVAAAEANFDNNLI